ncbi:MAG: trigger factor [bacterium]|nr:trigger factor [bacterium]
MTNQSHNIVSWKSLDIKNLPGSEIEIHCSVESSVFKPFRKLAIAEIQNTADLPGFRKGKIPEDIIVKKVGEMSILQDAAEILISEIYIKIIKEKDLDPIGRPDVKIVKLAPDNDLEFIISTAVVPEVTLPDYKNISKKEIEKNLDLEPATDKELENAIEEILKFHKKEKIELTDEFVKSLGAEFENVEDFKKKVRDSINREKEEKAREKRRLSILEKILTETKTDLPKILVEAELNKMMSQFEGDLEAASIKMKDYLEKIKKTEEELRKDWMESAEKKAKTQLIINEIAKKEEIKADENEVHNFAHYIIEQYKDADHDATHIYAETMITNKKVVEFLEGKIDKKEDEKDSEKAEKKEESSK